MCVCERGGLLPAARASSPPPQYHSLRSTSAARQYNAPWHGAPPARNPPLYAPRTRRTASEGLPPELRYREELALVAHAPQSAPHTVCTQPPTLSAPSWARCLTTHVTYAPNPFKNAPRGRWPPAASGSRGTAAPPPPPGAARPVPYPALICQRPVPYPPFICQPCLVPPR
eukprot:727227-Rhodomonas_salina.1